MNITETFKQNQITLNEAKVGLGLPPDFLFDEKYYFELFLFAKSLGSNEKENYINKIVRQSDLIV